jgi:hypothetical protein
LPQHSGGLDNTPSVIVAKQNNALVIYALDDVAARSGLAIGLPLANARAICPELVVFDADPPRTPGRSTISPTGAIASRRWWRSTRRMGCFWTSPAAPICSAANARCKSCAAR